MTHKTLMKLIILLFIFAVFFIGSKNVMSFGGSEIHCFGPDDCFLSGDCSTTTLICPDDQPGMQVYCGIGDWCGYPSPCYLEGNRRIEYCAYSPVSPPCDCSGVGWQDPPFWGGCDDCSLNSINNCGLCGPALAYCDGCNWSGDWWPFVDDADTWSTNGHKCVGNPKICSPGYGQCYDSSWLYTCNGDGCNYDWEECGSDYWTNEYRCVGTMQQRKYISRGCSGTACYSNEIWYNWEECGSDYWGTLYSCSGDWRTRQYFSRGCSGTSCYSTPSYQNWENCNNYDGWYGGQLRDYYCSAGACVYSGNTIPNVPTLIAPPNNTWINYDPTFQATVSDPDNNQVRAYFEILGYGSAYSSYVNSGQTASYGPANIATCYQNYWRAYAQDLGGLTSGWTGYWLYAIDKSTPINSISYATGTITTTSIPITLTESDAYPCSGIAEGDVDISINGGAWQNYTSTIDNFTYTGVNNNSYQFRYRVKDNANNWSGFVEGGIVTISLNQAPTASNLNVVISNNCDVVPSYHFSWTYSDPNSNTQSRFDFQADNNSGFSSPEVDTTVTGLSYPSPSSNSQAKTLVTSSTYGNCNYLTYNTTYYWRVKVYDSFGLASNWTSGSSFTTPVHHYPKVDFTFLPLLPNLNENINLTDASTCYDESSLGSDCSTIKGDTYQWTMTGGIPASAITENAITKYATLGLHDVTLQVTDSDNLTCSITKPIRVNYPLPVWREVMPF